MERRIESTVSKQQRFGVYLPSVSGLLDHVTHLAQRVNVLEQQFRVGSSCITLSKREKKVD